MKTLQLIWPQHLHYRLPNAGSYSYVKALASTTLHSNQLNLHLSSFKNKCPGVCPEITLPLNLNRYYKIEKLVSKRNMNFSFFVRNIKKQFTVIKQETW